MANDEFDIESELEDVEEDNGKFKRPENVGMPPVDPNFKEETTNILESSGEVEVSAEEISAALANAKTEYESSDVVEAPEKPSGKSVDPRAERTKVELPEDVIESAMKPTATPRNARRRVSQGEAKEVTLIEYTVGKGEKLRHIAKRFGTSPTAIEKLNHLTNPRHLVNGQVLLIQTKKGKR